MSSPHNSQRRSMLSEEYIQDSFHSYLKSSLTQAKAEKLLGADILASAESDLMITGPALCLYFAALRCTTSPPSVPLPRSTKTSAPLDLSPENCPQAFISFLTVWSSTVPRIQSLAPEHQHDLARIICNLPAVAAYPEPTLHGIAADLRAVAIEISQRRSFQERYGGDLQAALDAGPGAGAAGDSGVKVKASFVPPPMYDPTPNSSPTSSPCYLNLDLPPVSPPRPHPHQHPAPTLTIPQSHSPSHLSPYFVPRTPSPSRSTPSRTPSRTPSPSSSARRTPSPTFFPPTSPAIESIRETLYASLADVLSLHPSLLSLLTHDPPRAYFASVSLAILSIATTSVTPANSVIGVLGREITVGECPPELRGFMLELGAIGRAAKEMEEEDMREAMRLAQAGNEVLPPPRMDRVRKMLEEGVGRSDVSTSSSSPEQGRRSIEGRAVAFTNRINALALGLTKLKAFRERQRDVFEVLSAIGS